MTQKGERALGLLAPKLGRYLCTARGRRTLLMVLVACMLAGPGTFAGLPGAGAPAAAGPGSQVLDEARRVLQRSYVDEGAAIDARLTEGALRGMAEALGDTGHTRYLTPAMVRLEREIQTGIVEGIGARLDLVEGRVVVVAPLDDSPAQEAGLRPGDVILAVNARPVAGLPLAEVIGQILGPAGTSVDLSVESGAGRERQELRLTRRRLRVRNVEWSWVPGARVAHLRLAAFTRGVSEDLRGALADIRAGGAEGLVLDLRDNRGGLIEEAIATASQFLADGTVFVRRERTGKTTTIAVRPGAAVAELPVAVLVSPQTMSAAEIVTGALQDAKRAQVVGQRTFGAGTLLETFPLSDGSALLVGVAEWRTPAGRIVWRRGIEPDVPVIADVTAHALTPRTEREMTPVAFRAAGDAPLLRALQVLGEPGATRSAAAGS